MQSAFIPQPGLSHSYQSPQQTCAVPPPGLINTYYNTTPQSNYFPPQSPTQHLQMRSNNHFSPTPRGRGQFQRGKKSGRGSGRPRNQRSSSGVQERDQGQGQGQGIVTGMVHEVLFYDSLRVGRRPRMAAARGMEHVSDRRDLHGVLIFPEEKRVPKQARCLCTKCSE